MSPDENYAREVSKQENLLYLCLCVRIIKHRASYRCFSFYIISLFLLGFSDNAAFYYWTL